MTGRKSAKARQIDWQSKRAAGPSEMLPVNGQPKKKKTLPVSLSGGADGPKFASYLDCYDRLDRLFDA